MTSNYNNTFDISKDMDNCINNLLDIKNNPPDIVINNEMLYICTNILSVSQL